MLLLHFLWKKGDCVLNNYKSLVVSLLVLRRRETFWILVSSGNCFQDKLFLSWLILLIMREMRVSNAYFGGNKYKEERLSDERLFVRLTKWIVHAPWLWTEKDMQDGRQTKPLTRKKPPKSDLRLCVVVVDFAFNLLIVVGVKREVKSRGSTRRTINHRHSLTQKT